LIRISVIIVNYKAKYFLKNCIASVLSSDIMEKVEIIVVDNNSSDGSNEMLQKEFPEVKLLQNSENLGFSKANNKGASVAKGDYLLILNPDTVLDETTLSEMLDFSENQTQFGAAGVHFIDGSGKFLPESKRNFPNLKVAGAKLLGYSKYYYANHIQKDANAEIDILTGAFMFIKSKVYKEVGGFDEDFFMYGEDIDLSYRITKAGYKNHFVGTCKVVHFKGESTVKDKFYLRNFYGALSIFYKKHFPNNAALYVLIDSMINTIISVKSMSVPRRAKAQTRLVNWVYIGDDDDFLSDLRLQLPSSNGFRLTSISDEIKDNEMVLFDSGFCSYKDIVGAFSDPLIQHVKKRIVYVDRSFYLGSDTSDDRGEVVQL